MACDWRGLCSAVDCYSLMMIRAAGTVQTRYHVPDKGQLKERAEFLSSRSLTLPSVWWCQNLNHKQASVVALHILENISDSPHGVFHHRHRLRVATGNSTSFFAMLR